MVDVCRGLEIINNITAMMDVVDIPIPDFHEPVISYGQLYEVVIKKIGILTTKIAETVSGNITKEDYYNTFIEEIGITEKEIDELKKIGVFAEPIYMEKYNE